MRSVLSTTCLVLGLLSPAARAEGPSAPATARSVVESVEYLEDPTKQMAIDQVLAATDWKPSDSQTVSLGASNSRFWLKVKMLNHEPPGRPLFLRLNNALLHHIASYAPVADGGFALTRQGFLEIPSNRNAFGDPKFVLPASEVRGETVTHFLSVEATVPLNFVLAVASEETLYKDVQVTLAAFGVIFGIMLLMPFYNLLIYLFTRDLNFLLFSIFSMTLGLSIFVVEGLFSLMWPEFNLTVKERLLHFVASTAYILLVVLTRRLLATKENLPRFDRALVAISVAMLFFPVASLFGDSPMIILCAQLATAVSVMACMVAGILCFRKTLVAPFFILGFSFFLGGSIAFVLQLSGVIESNILTVHAVHFGAVFEEAFLSFAIALKINILKDELAARSKDLERANSTLSAEVEHGKRISRELEVQRSIAIHSAKLRAVGELAGGIAHQINNPLAILKLKLENLGFLLERAPIVEPEHSQILHQIQGTESIIARMAKIITSLLRMSRSSDNDTPTDVPLSVIVSEALEMCEQRFVTSGVKVRVAVDLADKVIRCNAIDVSQAILNVLVNAFDAIKDGTEPWISVEARVVENAVELMITDSGPGIPAHLHDKIMQPFFTTKPPGSGTGVGLSIAVDLVTRNKGRVYIETNCPNTRFVLSFPKTFQHISSERAHA